MSPVDLTLLERWSRGRDAEAFAEIVSRYSGMVYNTARRILNNRADAEDVTQECFLELARTGARIRASLGGWLHALATSRALDRIRRDSRRRAREADFAETAAAGGRDWEAIQPLIDAAVDALPEDLREPIVEHFFLGRTHEAIANDLGVTRPAVTQRIQKGVEEIRAHLAARGLTVAGAALVAGMAALPSEAVPVALSTALGRMALLGHAPASTAAGGSLLGATALKAAVAMLVVVGVIVGAWKYREPGKPQPPAASVAMHDVQAPSAHTTAGNAVAPNVAPLAAGTTGAATETGIGEQASSSMQPRVAPLLTDASAAVVASATRTYLPAATEAVLTGFVLDRDSGVPIAHARLSDKKMRTLGESDAQGIYRLYAQPGARSVFKLAADGYVPDWLQVDLPGGQEVRRDFRLEPGVDVDVRVVDEADRPVLGAFVEVERDKAAFDRLSGGPSESVLTDAQGHVRVKGVSRERDTYFRARATGYEPPRSQTFHGTQGDTRMELVFRLQGRTRGVIVGYVTDASGAPVPGVTVTYNPGNREFEATSDAEGRYRIEAVRSYLASGGTFFARGKGWAPVFRPRAQPGTDAEPLRVDFVMQPGHWIAGVVVDESGQPVPSAYLGFRSSDGYGFSLWYENTRADAQGRFRYEDLPGPQVDMNVSAPGFSCLDHDFPVDQEHRIVLKPRAVVLGQVVDAETRQPVQDFKVNIQGMWMSGDRGDAWESVHSEEGRFVLVDLNQDVNYRLIVDAAGYFMETFEESDKIQARPPEAARSLVVHLRKKHSLRGRMVDAETGEPLAGARVLYAFERQEEATFEWWRLNQMPSELEFPFLERPQRFSTANDGGFQVAEGDAPGTLWLWPPQHEPVTIRPRDRGRYAQDGDAGMLIRVPRGAVVRGRCLKDGQPWTAASVWLTQFYQTHPTDEAGGFRLEGLPAGRFTLSAMEGPLHHPELGLCRAITLAQGEEKVVDLGTNLGPWTVSGRLSDENGQPCDGAIVSFTAKFKWEYVMIAVSSDPEGRYQVSGLAPGPYRVFAVRNIPGKWESLSVEAAADVKKDRELDLVLVTR